MKKEMDRSGGSRVNRDWQWGQGAAFWPVQVWEG
jgi:hypothetical protein